MSAGAPVSLLAAILEKRPAKRGVLVEQPEVLPDADRLLSERGLRDRCEDLFRATRFELTRVLDTPSAFSIVEARPV